MKEEFKKNIIDKIKNGEIKQIPKWHFVLKSTALLLSFLGVALVTVYFIVFVTLVFREHEIFRLFDVDGRGVFAFIHAAPWLLFFIILLLYLVLQILIRKYSFIYTKPLFITILGVFVTTVIVSAGVFFLDRNQRFARLGEGKDMPILGRLEKKYRGENFENITHGQIVEISEEYIKIKTLRKERFYQVVPKDKDKYMSMKNDLILGDKVMVIGEKNDFLINADIIKKSDFLPFEKREKHADFLPELKRFESQI